MTSKLVVNTIEADTGISSVSFASSISLSSTSVFHFSNSGVNIGADLNINRPSAGVIGFNINGSEAARINANGFSGDGSQLTGLPAGLGTALSSVQTSPLNKLYYTDRVLSIGSTVTIDHPASASGAYTQYTDIQVEDNADLIVADGDDLIPDIFGIGATGTTGAGGAGRLLVDNIVNRSGTGAPTLPNGAVVTGVITATSSDVVIGTAGKGIDFSAQTTSSAGGVVIQSEKITHFEEGIYVPTIVCSSSGSITLNTSYNKLAYTRINNTVTVHGRVRVSAVSSPNGQQLRIGLPFTSNVLVGYGDAGRVFGYGRLENAAQHQYYYGISATAGNQDFVQIHRIDENTDNPANVCADVDSNARISVSFTYRAQ